MKGATAMFGNANRAPMPSHVFNSEAPMPPRGLFGQKRVRNTGVPVRLNHSAQDGGTAPPATMPQGNPLGGSMRQPFDYAAARAQMMGEQEPISNWQKAAAVIGGMMSAAGGGADPMMGVRSLQARQQSMADRVRNANEAIQGWQRDDYEAQRDADLNASRPFTIGRDRLQYNPATGDVGTLYDGAEDFELYANELGLEEGSPEYFKAVEDYVLRSAGPSAHDRDMSLDDHRTANDERLEGMRYGNRLGLESERQRNRLELRNTPQARAPSSSSGRSGGGPRVRVRSGERTATGANGETLVVRNGAWVPAE